MDEAPPVNWWSPVQVGAIAWESAGAASLRMKVVAEPFTAERPMVAVGFAPVADVMMQEPVESRKHPPES